MRRVCGWLLALLLVAGIARAEAPANPSDVDRAAIRDVITRQLEAFKRDDAAAAFGLASPGIQSMFGDAQTFATMVRTRYKAVYRPKSVGFGALTTMHGQLVQLVDLVGPDGAPALALYTMEREPDGSWRIAGCTLTDRPDQSA